MAGRGDWRWHAAGGAAILLFAVLLAIRLGVPGGFSTRPAGIGAAVPAGLPTGESWMSITQQGRKIGYANRILARTDEGFRFEERIFMQVRTMGIVQPLTLRTEARLKEDRTLASFRFDLASNLFGFKAEGTVKGKEMAVRIGEPGREKTAVIPLAKPPFLGGGILESLGAAHLQPGEARDFPVFDPASLGQKEAQVTFMGEEQVTLGGRSVKARKLSVEFMGMKQVAWVDRDGTILKEEGILGIVLERAGREEAMAGVHGAGAGAADWTEIASIAPSGTIAEPDRLRLLRVRLKGLEGAFDLDGGRQEFRKGVLTIRREAQAAGNRPLAGPKELAAFLRATPFIQSDDPKIRRTLEGIVGPADSEARKAEKIVAWVNRNLEKRPVLSIPSALDTLESRVGDCNEHAVLLAALARAAGIPAEVEAGLVWLRGRFYYHAWNALYLRERGGWVTADSVLGQLPADVTHLRFVRGSAERQLDLAGLIGKLGIEILEASQ